MGFGEALLAVGAGERSASFEAFSAAIDPQWRLFHRVDRKVRTELDAGYALTNVTTSYTRWGDWFAYLCAIISAAAVIAGLARKTADSE